MIPQAQVSRREFLKTNTQTARAFTPGFGFLLDKVTVYMTLSGGSFGRRYQWDYAAEGW
jgi:hypothetical protein